MHFSKKILSFRYVCNWFSVPCYVTLLSDTASWNVQQLFIPEKYCVGRTVQKPLHILFDSILSSYSRKKFFSCSFWGEHYWNTKYFSAGWISVSFIVHSFWSTIFVMLNDTKLCNPLNYHIVMQNCTLFVPLSPCCFLYCSLNNILYCISFSLFLLLSHYFLISILQVPWYVHNGNWV